MPEYVSTTEAAEMLGMTAKHIQRLCLRKRIEASQPFRDWRIKRSVIEQMLEGKRGEK